MEDRFSISEIYICPVSMVNIGVLKPDLSFPTRFCVIDKQNGVAIDIKTNLKYDYIKTMSHLYVISQISEKIKDNRRVAILPFYTFGDYGYDLDPAKNIIKKLKDGQKFQDGNEVFDNKQYLAYLKKEHLEEQNQLKNVNKKTKKLGKRKK